ncbi:MAG TPA: hypothetical protein VK668_05810 [Mucilaginibacter sp.]|nr:hypothetical protein [Mucilaginibacter sp.]
MKKIIFTAAIFISCLSAQIVNAQVHVSLGVNINSQPEWGPVGYDHVDYYYIPDVDAYYDVPAHQYVYLSGGGWVHRTYLPARYRGYDMYHGYKVVVNEPRPWIRHDVYRTRYASYRGHGGQAFIRDSRDVRYRDHWRGRDHGRPIGIARANHGRAVGIDRGGFVRGHDRGGGHGRGGDHGHRGGGDHGHDHH